MPQNIVQTSVSVVLQEKNKVLLVREGRGKKHGLWNFPTGRLSAGEDPMTAALREVAEESGYRGQLHSLLGIYVYHPRAKKTVLRYVFMGSIQSGEARVDGQEIMDLRWFTWSEIDELIKHRLIWREEVLSLIWADVQRGRVYDMSMVRWI